MPRLQFVVAAKTGGILIGAEDESGRLVGCVFSVPGLRHGRVVQWSHLLGVTPEARGRALGLRLKLAQRERALARGIDLIEWTCDPLLAGNARLNVRRLGCVVEAYLDDVYGPSTSPLHRVCRPIASSRRGTSAHRTWRGASRPGRLSRATPASARRRTCCGRAKTGRSAPRTASPTCRATSRGCAWRFPPTSRGCWVRRTDLALAWRHAARQVFHTYFARGYRVVDVDADCGAPRPSYLLALRTEARCSQRPFPTPNLVEMLSFGALGVGRGSSARACPSSSGRRTSRCCRSSTSRVRRRSPPGRRLA